MTAVASAPERVPAGRRIAASWEAADYRWIIGLTVVAFLLRLWVALSVGQTRFSLNDAGINSTIAANLAHGHGFRGVYGQATAQWPPAWPFLLSLVYRVFGVHATAGELLNVVLGTATIPLLFYAARRTLGRPAAIVVGAGMSLLVSQLFWPDVLIAETFFTFLLAVFLAVLAVVAPGRVRSAVIIGAVLAAATLTRGEGFLLISIPIAMWWPELPRRVLARQTAVIVGVVVLCVIPWTIRNASEMHAFVPISTNFGSTFWAGHNPRANGEPVYPSQQLLNSVTAPVTSPKRELETDKLLRKKALSWMESNPLGELRLIPLKLIALNSWDGQVIGAWIDQQASRAHPVLSQPAQYRIGILADAGWFALLAAFLASLFVFGKALWRRRPILRGALTYLGISVVLYGFVFYGNFRYRAPLEPLMLLVAAPLLEQLWALRAKRLG